MLWAPGSSVCTALLSDQRSPSASQPALVKEPFQSLVNPSQTAINSNSKMPSLPLLGISKETFLWKAEEAAAALLSSPDCSEPERQLLPLPTSPSASLQLLTRSQGKVVASPCPGWLGRAGELLCFTASRSVSSTGASKGPSGRYIILWCHSSASHPRIVYSLPHEPPSLFPPALPPQHAMLVLGSMTLDRWKGDVRLEEAGVCKHNFFLILLIVLDAQKHRKGGF